MHGLELIFINLVYSFSKYLPNICCVTGTDLGSRDMVTNKEDAKDSPSCLGAYIINECFKHSVSALLVACTHTDTDSLSLPPTHFPLSQ